MSFAAVIIDNRPDKITEAIKNHIEFIPKDWPIIVVSKEDTSTTAGYNNLLTSERFWRGLPDTVLIFQADSMLLRHGIEEFTGYDFIGAPIPKIGWPAMNGGLSLRKREAMLKVIREHPYQQVYGNEDIYFCNRLWNLPDYDVARRFSVETEFALGSLGCHAIDKYLTPPDCNKIVTQYNLHSYVYTTYL